jgi:hypothetical protein
LAGVMEAVEDALAAQEMALFQTIHERGKGVVLVTTLAHSSDQWISSEVRIASPDAGPQVFGSSLTYMRRYSALGILGIAPDADDDGKAAQDRTDQQGRQSPPQRVEQPRRAETATKAKTATQDSPTEPSEPVHMPIQMGNDGPLLGKWTRLAIDELNGRTEAWRRAWLELHRDELDELRRDKPEYANRVESMAIAPDLPAPEAAA